MRRVINRGCLEQLNRLGSAAQIVKNQSQIVAQLHIPRGLSERLLVVRCRAGVVSGGISALGADTKRLPFRKRRIRRRHGLRGISNRLGFRAG